MKRFTPEFKQEAALLVIEQGYSIAQACSAMNVSDAAMRRWVEQYQQELKGITPAKGKAITAEQREIQELKKRIALLEEEKTILKKATALLMSDSIKSKR